jgi:hypothetical protein
MFKIIINWIEVWSPLIPLYIFIIKRPNEKQLQIIAAYLLTALCLNFVIDISWRFNNCMPPRLRDNNFLYNISSILRVFFFTFFFMKTTSLLSKKIYVLIAALYMSLFTLYFIFLGNNFFYFSSLLHSIESVGLLMLCVFYFISLIKAEEVFFGFDPGLIIISGLVIYESVNFFVFLFYSYLMANNAQSFAKILWSMPNIIFFIFCLFITRAFYGRYN